MKLKKHIAEFEKHLLKEESVGSANVMGHYGRGGSKGKDVDDIFAGGFIANDNLKGDLTRQFDKRKNQRKELNLEDDNDLPLGGFYDIETDALLDTYEYWDEVLDAKIEYNDKMTPEHNVTSVIDWEAYDALGWKGLFDKRKQYDKEYVNKTKMFINTSNRDKILDLNQYDKIEDKTEENKKFINDTSNWKSIYDEKKY